MTFADREYAERAPRGQHRPLTSDAAAVTDRLPIPVLIYLILVVTPVNVNIGPLFLTGLRIYLLIMIIPLMIRLASGKCGKVLAVDVFFILHMAWAYVALQVNNPSQAITQLGSLGAEMLGGYLMARAYIRSKGDFIALCNALGIIVCLTLPFAVYESLTGDRALIRAIKSIPGLGSVVEAMHEPRMGLLRAQVMMTHPIHYGLFCSTAFALILMGTNGIIPNIQRLGMTIGVALAVFLSLSSGALLPLILMSFMIIWWRVLHRTGWAWTLLLVVFAIAYVMIDILSNRTPIQVFFSYATFSAHNAFWRALIFEWGMLNVWNNPIFGIGLNDWVRPYYMRSGSMDNFWLVMAVRYGIPGFLLVALGCMSGTIKIARAQLDWDLQLAQMRRAWVITFVGLAFTLCTVHVWANIYSYVFFMFGSAIWMISAQPSTKVKSEKSTVPAANGSRYSRFAPVQRRGHS